MKTKYIIAPIVMLAILAALSTPVTADLDELYTRCWGANCLKGTIDNGSVIVQRNSGSVANNWTITLPPGDVKVAYVHIWTYGFCQDNPTAEFWNADGEYDSIYFDPDNLPTDRTEIRGVWWADFIISNTHYYWKVNAKPGVNKFKASGCGEPAYFDSWFVAVINDTDVDNRTHTGHWWHNTGYRKTYSYPDYARTHFYNDPVGDPLNTDANYSLWTAQTHFWHPPIEFNGEVVGTVSGHLHEWNVNNVDADGDQLLTFACEEPGCDEYYVYFGTLAEKITLGEPKLEPIDIIFPDMMRSDTAYTIKAKIKNTGDAASELDTATLHVNGAQYSANIPVLNPGENETVSFSPDVNLPEKICYDFRVVVASCSNELTEHYQVGNVIVVNSDSEFETLDLATCVDGKCYIKDLTIENCVGNGITIQDTIVPFVISNCTVHNCNWKVSDPEPAGIYLNRVKNGTIGNCSNTIANNTNAGIRVKNSTNVSIKDNRIVNNSYYGIYAYPGGLSTTPETRDDCKNITVTNNTVIDHVEAVDLIAYNCTVNGNTIGNDTRTNTLYGIFLMSNYSKVYNNTVENFGSYGIKLFNSSDNCIYGNTFTDNNLSHPEHQAYDMWKGQSALNNWNSTVALCYYNGTGIGGHTIGNNWSDYTGVDVDPNDKIGDTWYPIDGGTMNDTSPLMEPWANLNAHVKCGDVDGNTAVNIDDGKRAAKLEIDTCKWAADVDCSHSVNIDDGKRIAKLELNCCDPCCVL